ncbi:ParB/RepB/Spo0J family partition protein, partial [Candidatus Allofournierella excrementavium]|uniref:ParB/RepB/Spo0J family partition protein n=1 Tax=Candidatus Allofournierella excrementavium TaxID=2838591 RepID=UPI003AF6D5BA
MADDKKNIPDAGGKVDEPPKPGKVEPVKADFPVQDQPTPARAEAPVTEDASKVVTPPAAEKPVEGKTAPDPAAEQPAPAGEEAPKDKDAPAPSKGDTPPGKGEKQTTIPGMEDPAPTGKVVDFTAARDGAMKGNPPEKAVAPDKGKQADKAKDAAKPRRGRPARADKAAPDKAKPQPRDKMSQSKPPAGKGAPATAEAPAATEQPPAPRDATRGMKEEIVYLNLSELHPFKNHPFGVRDDAEMQGLVESVKAAGVNQPALVRPREGGGYEIIAGHRRQRASELAGFANMPCIVRNMTDDEAILAMTDDNLRHRERILPTEKAAALKQQVEAIKHQGARPGEDDRDAGKRSTQIVGDRNGMNYKQVQRYIRLTELVPDLQKMVDEKQLSFTPAVEISFIRPRHQKYIAVAIEGQVSSPSLSQAQKMRELDKEGKLNGDVIDGILSEQKKEVDKVIINSAELEKYFGKDKTPREMKDTILALLDEWKEKQPPELG